MLSLSKVFELNLLHKILQMKKFTLLFLIILSKNILFAQITLQFNPIADASVGFHDGGTSADVNYGDASHFSAFSQPAVTVVGENAGWGLMQFDLTSIPVGSEIISAELNLIAFGDDFSSFINSGHQGSNACWLSRIIESWEESIVTWNTKPDITEIGQIELPASTDPYQNYTVDMTSFVQEMVDYPISNFGVALQLQNESPTRGLMFKSSDVPEEDQWPELTVTYSEQTYISSTIKNESAIKLYPNPATDMVKIAILNYANETYIIELYNMIGELVVRSSSNEVNPQISVKNIDRGIYNLKIRKQTDDHFDTAKLIIN